MVGGKVIETLVVDTRVWINVQDWDEANKKPRHSGETCGIYVEDSPQARSISNGDIVWWQGKRAFWTAKDKNGKTVGKADTPLVRRGFSGAKRPEVSA